MPEATGGGPGAAAPYPRAARARLLLAYEAYGLSELARSAVPVGRHELRRDGTPRSPGTALADAAQVLAAARRLLAAAVVYERVGGASWQLVGDVLDVPADTASERFARAEARFRAGAPEADDPWWRAHVLRVPREAAHDLDDWVLRRADGEADPGAAPVSGGLP
ncbi:hypothetical protein [Streptomyces sp. NRRL B-1347]|uniref:hypothetical protein n=1 Tax=Streptomyces sp. NRRL B-1347 TaxID=1476877 RepID=UPI000A78775F|nr:hypothetical protein [Streptomyces sp. NRRL B-1347]